MEVVPQPFGTDHVLTLAGPDPVQGSGSEADHVLDDAPVGGASQDEPFASDHEDEPSIELVTRECNTQNLED